jgi:hypothetical protein
MREGRALGNIAMRRCESRPFTEKQVRLVQMFADQAAIAIENVRLFNETKEALERQRATSEVLGVISSSPTDVAPVYRAILDNVTRLCEAKLATLFLYDGEFLTTAAHCNATPDFASYLDGLRIAPSRETPSRRAALERRVVHDKFSSTALWATVRRFASCSLCSTSAPSSSTTGSAFYRAAWRAPYVSPRQENRPRALATGRQARQGEIRDSLARMCAQGRSHDGSLPLPSRFEGWGGRLEK